MPKKNGKKIDKRTKEYRQKVVDQEYEANNKEAIIKTQQEKIQTLETSLAEQFRRVAQLTTENENLARDNSWFKQDAENGSFAVRDLAYALRKCRFS